MSILRVRDKDGNIQEILTIRGEQGERGPKGDAPVRGVDYYTETDKQEIIEDVLENVNIGITEEKLEETLEYYTTFNDLALTSEELYNYMDVSLVDWDAFEEALYGEDSDIVNNTDLEQILSNYPTFGDVETYLTTSVEEGGMNETLVISVIESEDFNARISSNFYDELSYCSIPNSEEQGLFKEAVLAALPAGGDGVTEEDVETMLDAELGDKDEIFNYTEDYLALDTEGSYVDENSEYVEQEGCNVYYLCFDGTEEFAGREIRVKTYMYGDMTIYNAAFDEHITNTKANITTDPESGIFDYAFSFDAGYGIDLYISFCENEFFDKPIFYEKKGTVWEEIRKSDGRQSQFVNIPYLSDTLSWYVMYEDVPDLVSEQIDINMEHITEQVIAALPVYNGEYSVEVV